MPDPHLIPQLFAAQRAGDAARRVSFGLAERRAALDRLAQAVRRNEGALIQALAADLGRPKAEVILMDFLNTMQSIRQARRKLRAWMRPRRVAPTLVTFGSTGWVEAQPRGTCLILAPWNAPFQLALAPLAYCLAAGNAAIVKPSELTPATSALIARIVAETFPPDLVAVVEGDKSVAEALLDLPFDHIYFTGSPAVGKLVMAAAARHLSSVTLELGGKSPVIIGPQADLAAAAGWVTFGKFLNAGQICISPDHLYVHASVRAAFLDLLTARIAKAYGATPSSPNLARIVTPAHAARLNDLLTDAVAKGARPLLATGQDGLSFGPQLVEGLTPDMRLAQEEIFGPILPVHSFDDIESVIEKVNAGAKPLALYIFDRDPAWVRRITRATTSGGVGINLTMVQFSHGNLPFGGVNGSGIGSAHGHASFLAFSHQRAVLKNRFLPLPLVFPPYSPRVMRLIGLMKRVLG
jgi:aldehyde dehydrogenase (NAD+)